MDSTQAKALADQLLDEVVGGWTLISVLGTGKSAVVFAAKKGDEQAALKVFHPELVERYGKSVQLERIAREVSLVGASHNNLVKILGGGECDKTNTVYVVMEKVSPINLHHIVGNIALEKIPEIIHQIASAARFLEDRGLAHRDIKPENIAVNEDQSAIKLLDLGVLRPVGISDLTDVDSRAFIGTLRYSSPEYLRRREEDTIEGWRAVTFYQIGAVLHDLLMGKRIFEEYTEPFAVLADAIETINPEIFSADANYALLAKYCLCKNPSTRLALLNWESFLPPKDDSATANTVARRERIRMRQTLAEELSNGTATATYHTKRLQRLALLDITNRIEARISTTLNELACFPLREIAIDNAASDTTIISVVFIADNELGLHASLHLRIEVKVIDIIGDSKIIEVLFAAYYSSQHDITGRAYDKEHIFSGELNSFVDGSKLSDCLTEALENAYIIQDQGKDLSQLNFIKFERRGK